MDPNMLREAIRIAGGAEFIYGFIYDNTGRTIFKNEPFKESMIQGNFIVIEERDLYGSKVKVLKPIETIQTIIALTNKEDRELIDPHYQRS